MYFLLADTNGLITFEQYLDCPHATVKSRTIWSSGISEQMEKGTAAVHGLYDYLNYIVISHFDRCSGSFSQSTLIKFGNKDSFGVGAEFSPNSRFLCDKI